MSHDIKELDFDGLKSKVKQLDDIEDLLLMTEKNLEKAREESTIASERSSKWKSDLLKDVALLINQRDSLRDEVAHLKGLIDGDPDSPDKIRLVKFKSCKESVGQRPMKIKGYVESIRSLEKPQDLFRTVGWLCSLCPENYFISLIMHEKTVMLAHGTTSWKLLEFEDANIEG